MVVAGSDIGGERPQRIERRFMAMRQLFGHIASDHLHRHMSRPLYHDLHIVFPSDFGQLAQRIKLGELRLIVGVLDRPRT